MLKTRIITGLILAPLVVLAVFYLPTVYFAIVFWLVAALGLYEWGGFLHMNTPQRFAYLALFAVLAFGLYLKQALFFPLLLMGCGVWLFAFVVVLSYPARAKLFADARLLFPLGLLIGLFAWVALLEIRTAPDGKLWLLWLLLVVWGADVGAYFAGKTFGRTRLAPEVSPGKTWEGVLGGLLLPGIVCGAWVVMWQNHDAFWLFAMVFLIGISVVGDLFESVLKRSTGVKDSGTLLPGHGGVLDRIDALLAALPFMAIFLR